MYCTRCGGQNTDGSRYCTVCGASLVNGEQTGAAPGSGYGAGSAAPPYQSAAPGKRLRRVMSEKKIAGVCAGFAEYFDMDVTLVRLIWVGLVLLPPAPGVIIYIVAWIILPKG
jgi:phage shock protein C